MNGIGQPRRHAIVVLSDGEDTSSLMGFDEVIDVAARSDTVIYAIGLTVPGLTETRGSQDAQFVLRRFAQQTGGRAFFPKRGRGAREHLRRNQSRALESVLARIRVEQHEARRSIQADCRPTRSGGRRRSDETWLLRADQVTALPARHDSFPPRTRHDRPGPDIH